MLSKNYITEEKIKELDLQIRNEVAESAELAFPLKLPKETELFNHVYKGKSINDICKR